MRITSKGYVFFTIVVLSLSPDCSAQWGQSIDTVTSGATDDVNPEVDHAGIAIYDFGLSNGPLTQEWVVFERWENGTSSIAAVKFNANQTKWDTSVSIVSPAGVGTVQKYPDICTNLDSISVCAWQESTDSVWNIYCSFCDINNGIWSKPIEVTNDSVSNTNVEVRASSDSSFLLIWRRGRSVLYSVLQDDQVSTPQTLASSNCDSTEYDFGCDILEGEGMFIWTNLDTSGNRFCLLSTEVNPTSLSLSSLDTIKCDGDMANPRFMCNGTSFSFTFNFRQDGTQEAWQATLGYTIPRNWMPEQLAADTNSSYSNAVSYVPVLLTGVSEQLKKTSQIYAGAIYAWQKETAGDTSIVFVGSTSDSLENGSNPSISPMSFFIGDKTSQAFVVWESDRGGRYHIYSRGYLWEQDGVNEPAPAVSNYKLEQNYPNPFNPSTVISYDIPKSSHVTLSLYDILGRQVANLVNEEKQLGSYQMTFDGSRLASGVYFYRLQAGTYSNTKKLLLLK